MAEKLQKLAIFGQNLEDEIFSFKNPLGTFFQPNQDVALCQKLSKSDGRD